MPRNVRRLAVLITLTLVLGGCRDAGPALLAGDDPVLLAGGDYPAGVLAVTHGGVGSPADWSDDCRKAADQAWAEAWDTGRALDGALAGTVSLEDVPRFNAGTGANIRLDGETIQMDAALMTSAGDFAAVAVIERVRNPILVARAVLDTPHRLLAGEGATRFAHAVGFADEVPVCAEAREKYRRRVARLLRGETGDGYDTFDWRAAWNFPGPPPTAADTLAGAEDPLLGDTVGTVVRDEKNNFAVTLSTGGTSITLDGRVGDVPIYGCGSYAGPAGAVACTGHGEEIIRQALARRVYEWMAAGATAREAVRSGVLAFPEEWTVGVIAVGRDGWGVAANRQMAWGEAGYRAP
jgi:isoaspartyl peptidase/L-asparaginase-like protein (Ntn-hydrolase superfamily)